MTSLFLIYFVPTWLVTLGVLWLLRRAAPLWGPRAWPGVPAAALAALGFVPVFLHSDWLTVPVPIPPYLWRETVEHHNTARALRAAVVPLLAGTASFWLAGRLLALGLRARARRRT